MGKADTHLHTQYSGYSRLGVMKFPESVISPEMQVDKGRENGMDVIAITDHDETRAAFIAQEYAKRYDDIEVIVGEEVTTRDGEVIGLFLNERIPADLPIGETIDIIREQGGLVIAPHPFSYHVFGLKEQMLVLDVDGFETINGGHPDSYSNRFAKIVMDRYPGRWAEMSGSDAHSLYTSGYNWTEFEGTTAEDFRRSVLNRTTKAAGVPAPVLGQVQWSLEVALGGAKLIRKALRGQLVQEPDDHLVEKILKVNDLKKVTGMLAAYAYSTPWMSGLATVLSTAWLARGARKMNAQIPQRLAEVERIIEEYDAGRDRCLPGRGQRPRGIPSDAHGFHQRRHGAAVAPLRPRVLLLAGEGHMEVAARVLALPGERRRDRAGGRDETGIRGEREGPQEGRGHHHGRPSVPGTGHRRHADDRTGWDRSFGRRLKTLSNVLCILWILRLCLR